MLAKTALLIVSNPKQIGRILPCVQKQVKKTLYIQLLSALTEPFGNFHSNVLTSWPTFSSTIHGIYSQAAVHCRNLDVRVLLSGIKYNTITQIKTKTNIDMVIFDKKHDSADIKNFVKARVSNISRNYNVVTLDSGEFESLDAPGDGKVYRHSVLGGTFDRLHIAHKLLLSEAVLHSEDKVTVGVTEESMLSNKILWELVESLDVRINGVKDFLTDICSELIYDVVPISDPFGPSIVDPTMEMIVVSEETIRGGEKINEIRVKEKKLNPLDILPVKLIDEPLPAANEESKISSSTTRIRLLGTLLKPVERKEIPDKPYVIGLTGGVASGKSGVTNHLSEKGAAIINCDLVAHDVYKKGKPCYSQLLEHFGEGILGSDGEIDRKVLGPIVFNNKDQMQKLNSIVWPGIAAEVEVMIKNCDRRVVVVEAAVLIMAGWEKFCHEVWTTIVPRSEAVKRLISRNNLSEDQALARINNQPTNKTYVDASNVVFCPLWEVEFTKSQVDKAWGLLQNRL